MLSTVGISQTDGGKDSNPPKVEIKTSTRKKNCFSSTKICRKDIGRSTERTRNFSQNSSNTKYHDIRTLPLSNGRSLLLSTRRTLWKSLAVLFVFFLYFIEANTTEQASYRPLIPKQRREVQKEILSVMGLDRRPRPVGDPARGLQHDSAPLYMIGLYNTVSGTQRAEIFGRLIPEEVDSDVDSNPDFPQKRHSPHSQPTSVQKAKGYFVGPFSNTYPYNEEANPSVDWQPYDDAQMQTLLTEVGIPENLEPTGRRPVSDNDMPADDAFVGNTLEHNLLGEADVIMSFIAKNRGNNDVDEATRAHLKRHRAFFFDVDQIPQEDVLTAAKFRLYKDVSDESMGNSTLRVNVYHATKDSNRQFVLKILESRLVRTSQEGWLVFDVISACQNWLLDTNHNMGLRVAVETLEGRSINLNKAGIVGRRGDSSKQAFLVSFLTQGTGSLPNRFRRRLRRGAAEYLEEEEAEEEDDEEDEDDEDNEFDVDNEYDEFDIEPTQQDARRTKRSRKSQKNRSRGRGNRKPTTNTINYYWNKRGDHVCHKEELYVNFQDLNWDGWIIAPSGYKAYRCMGVCRFPLSANMNATNHAIVQTLVHLLKPDKLPQPCCSPTNLDAISVLYYDDDNNVVYKKYKDMVVRDCGCH